MVFSLEDGMALLSSRMTSAAASGGAGPLGSPNLTTNFCKSEKESWGALVPGLCGETAALVSPCPLWCVNFSRDVLLQK